MEQLPIEGTKTEREKTAGETLRDAGIEQVAEHNPDFLTAARALALELARKNQDEGLALGVWSDDLRRECEKRGIAPAHPNAWGAVFHMDGWRATAFRKSRIPSAHARQVRFWEKFIEG